MLAAGLSLAVVLVGCLPCGCEWEAWERLGGATARRLWPAEVSMCATCVRRLAGTEPGMLAAGRE